MNRRGDTLNVEEMSACTCCQVCRSSSPPLRNIQRSAKNGCERAARTALSLKSGLKLNTVGLDTTVAIMSRAAGYANFNAGSSEQMYVSL